MNRKSFFQNAAILGGASILPANCLFAQNIADNGIDHLTDTNGIFIQQPLPLRIIFPIPFTI